MLGLHLMLRGFVGQGNREERDEKDEQIGMVQQGRGETKLPRYQVETYVIHRNVGMAW